MSFHLKSHSETSQMKYWTVFKTDQDELTHKYQIVHKYEQLFKYQTVIQYEIDSSTILTSGIKFKTHLSKTCHFIDLALIYVCAFISLQFSLLILLSIQFCKCVKYCKNSVLEYQILQDIFNICILVRSTLGSRDVQVIYTDRVEADLKWQLVTLYVGRQITKRSLL